MRRRRLSGPALVQTVAFAGLWASVGIVAFPVAAIVALMLRRGIAGLTSELFSSGPQGILPAIVGTVALVLLTALIAAPLGVAAAVYLTEYARAGPLARLIRMAIINLAGVPSVVYGLFGLALFVVLLQLGRCLLAGALTLALLVLPLVISATEEALRQVPRGLREGSWALGGTRWQTIRRIVLPTALPGIMTGLILAIGRAAGETAPILFTAAFYALTHPYPKWITDPVLALPYQLFVLTTEVPKVPQATKWAYALVLVTLVLSLNLAAIILRTRLRRAQRW